MFLERAALAELLDFLDIGVRLPDYLLGFALQHLDRGDAFLSLWQGVVFLQNLGARERYTDLCLVLSLLLLHKVAHIYIVCFGVGALGEGALGYRNVGDLLIVYVATFLAQALGQLTWLNHRCSQVCALV